LKTALFILFLIFSLSSYAEHESGSRRGVGGVTLAFPSSGNTCGISDTAFYRDDNGNERFYVATSRGIVYGFDPETGERVATFKDGFRDEEKIPEREQNLYPRVALASHKPWVAVGGREKKALPNLVSVGTGMVDDPITIWDLNTGKVISKVPVDGMVRVLEFAFSPDPRYVATTHQGSGNGVVLWDISKSPARSVFADVPSEDDPEGLKFSLDGETLSYGKGAARKTIKVPSGTRLAKVGNSAEETLLAENGKKSLKEATGIGHFNVIELQGPLVLIHGDWSTSVRERSGLGEIAHLPTQNGYSILTRISSSMAYYIESIPDRNGETCVLKMRKFASALTKTPSIPISENVAGYQEIAKLPADGAFQALSTLSHNWDRAESFLKWASEKSNQGKFPGLAGRAALLKRLMLNPVKRSKSGP